MKIKPCLDGQCILVPASPVLSRLNECGGTRLKVLLTVLASPEFDEESVLEELDITKRTFRAALDYWCQCGVISREEESAPKKSKGTKTQKTEDVKKEKASVPKTKTLMRASSLPTYSSDELADLMEDSDVSHIIDGCQQIVGKMFNTSECQTVVGLIDYLKLDDEYIYLLFSYCKNIGKKSMRYIEKTAIELFDEGVTEYKQLDARILTLEQARGMDKPLRRLFGVGNRAFTQKEQKFIDLWADRQYSMKLIERAYEITVENTGSGSMPYCNAVLDSWHQKGITTIEQVDEETEKYRHDKEAAKDKKGSFETDDYFEAALRRSYGDK